MKVIAVIPARYKSSRYPGKPLAAIMGKPMIRWVMELSAEAVGVSNVYVATDDERIQKVVEEAGFNSVLTSSAALTGTDRLAEVAGLIDADIYVNIQGDEPLVDPADIKSIIAAKIENMEEVINGYCSIGPEEDPVSVNIPKVIFNEDHRMIYMSRSLIPGYKDPAQAPSVFYKQVCIYAFTKEELHAFGDLGRKSVLEASEDIEILRFLELGKSVRMVETRAGSLAVDVPSDIPAVERALTAKLVSKKA